ncbi:creatininase family protein [Sulfitobacter sp. BDSS02]|nr:creatininase family protein [Sulfitobacter sp. BDSS02]MBR9851155.1 creatininase family protein [Paracoccaceae bacterium]
MSVQGYWSDLPSSAFRALPSDTIAVLPLGATEQHGPHLPLSVDSDIIGAVAARMLDCLAPEQSVLVLPSFTVSKSDEHDAFPGTLTYSAETLLAMLREIGRSVARAGVDRLLFLNGHGGNAALLQIAARELRQTENLVAASCSWGGFAEWETHFDPAAYSLDIHAGECETSMMLAIRPDRVDMTKAGNFRSALSDWESEFPRIGLGGKPVNPGWLAQDLHPEGACGNASAATVEKGEALLESAGRNLADFLVEFSRFDHGKSAQ